MKKSIINRNYSLLVLVILILYITYINIPNSLIMRGGGEGSNPYDSMSTETLDKNLMKHSMVYNILNNKIGFYVYIGIVIILLILSIYYFNLQVQVQGIPGIANPSVDWDNEGATFLTQFFLLDRESKGLNAPGTTSVPPVMIENFGKKTIDFASTAKLGIDVYCNIVSPCNICKCTGPDPNYGGDQKFAPIIPYDGVGCIAPKTLETFNEGLEVPNPGANIVETAQKLGLDHRIRSGEIPNCCCHLFNTLGIKISDIHKDVAQTLTDVGKNNTPPPANALQVVLSKSSIPAKTATLTNSTFPIGIPVEMGCEPNETIKPLQSSDGKLIVPNNGLHTFAMIQSCLSTKPITYGAKPITTSDGDESAPLDVPDLTKPNNGKSPYDVNMTACSDPKMKNQLVNDRGYSKNSLYRNNTFFNELKTIIKNAKNKTPSTSFDISKYIGKLPIAPAVDTAYPWTGPVWPVVHPAFMGDSVTTEWFYISGNSKYELKIDNYLKEVYAFPVKVNTVKNTNTTKNISSATAGVAEATAFITSGLVDKYLKYYADKTHIYHGAYIFP
jgi:hypothetical protein